MEKCREWAGLDHGEAYKQWNGGQGALVVLDESHLEAYLMLAERSGIEAKKCGQIVDSNGKPTLALISKYRGGDRIS